VSEVKVFDLPEHVLDAAIREAAREWASQQLAKQQALIRSRRRMKSA
jgi:hypothetical protein